MQLQKDESEDKPEAQIMEQKDNLDIQKPIVQSSNRFGLFGNQANSNQMNKQPSGGLFSKPN